MRGRLQKANPITLFDLWIQVKDGPPINLGANLNEPQKIALDYLAPGWREGDYTLARGARLTFLKGRQEGMTTLILALCFCHVCNVSDQNAVFIADDASNSETAFGKIAYFWEHLPEEKRPKRKYSSRKELVLASNDSTFRILTAGAGRVGQSRTIHILHCSEVSNWPNAVETTPGLLQSIPSSGFIAFETTAKGDGEYDEQTNEYLGGKGAFFAVEYKRAKAGKNGYTAIFLPWHKMREYRRTPPEWYTQENLVSIEDNADDAPVERRRLYARFGDERSLVIRFGLDLPQLWWRRCKIEEPGMGLLMFRQEYPCDEEEAFAVSGQRFVPLFDTQPGGMHVVPYRSLEELTELYGAPDEIVAGYDWGKSAFFACGLIARWSSGIRRREVLEECGARGKTEDEHAADIIAMFKRRGFKPSQIPIFADPSIFGPEKEDKRVGEYIEDKLRRHGLRLYRALNDRATTHPGVRDLVDTPGRLAIQVQCQGVITSLPTLETDPKNPEFWVEGGSDHFPDAIVRYGCQSEIPAEAIGSAPALPVVGGTSRSGVPVRTRPASIFVGGNRRF